MAGLAVLLAFVRYVYDGDIQEDLFLCKTLPTSTTGEEIFKILDTFMSENKIPWKKCLDVCTDGAKSMTGSIKGVVSRIKKENPECSNSHLHSTDINCLQKACLLNLAMFWMM